MKRFGAFFIFFLSLAFLSATPWADNLFILVETDTPRNIQRAIETDYSFRDFTRTREKENLLMAALKYARGNDVIDLLLHEAKISPDEKTRSGVTGLMYACQYATDIEAVKNVLFTGAKNDSKKEKRILTKDKNGLTCFDYARKNLVISEEVLDLLNMYADEPVPEPEPEPEIPVQTAEEPAPEPELPEEPAIEIAETPEPEPEEPPVEVAVAPEPEPEPEEEPEEAPPKPEPPQEKNALLDFASLSSPLVVPESIYLYDYADDKYSQNAIPPSLIAAEEAKKHFIQNANAKDSDGQTKLMLAAKNGDIQQIEDLLYSGAEIDAKDNEGWTALMYAARFQINPDVTRLLLLKGANRTRKNKYGITALLLAAGYSENSEVISILLESYNANSDEAREAFAYGISNYNSPSSLQAFIKKNVPLNIPYNGKTPLMLACQTNKDTKIIEWLLENGASKYQVEASTGKTAYDYAKENSRLPHDVTYWSLNPNS